MNISKIHVVAAACATFAAGAVQAAPLGVVKPLTASDTTLSAPSLTYVYNGVDANTGLLTVKANGATLYETAAAGGSSFSQAYITPPGDIAPDVTLTFQIHNGSGGFAAGSFAGGSVSIGYGNATSSPRYNWVGNMTAFGFTNTGNKYFDATWNVTGDQYQNMPATMSQFVNGFLTGGTGGAVINTTTAVSGFASSWSVTSGVTADVFASPVPEANSAGMLAAGLAVLVAFARRRKTG